jgi:hypothetical protein
LKKKINRIKRSVFFFLVLVSLGSFQINSPSRNYYTATTGPIIEEKETELTPENVYAYLERMGVKHPEIVLRQSILETGWYECEQCSLRHNNIFGFRYKKKYLEFENWKEGVEYYKKWQDKKYKGGDYYKFLKNVGYATSTTYISKLKQIKVDFLK